MVTEAMKERLSLAKSVSLIGLIKELGYQLEETGGYYRMISPFRSESKASVDIDKRKPNKWHDRGTGKHGDVIDFVQELFSMTRGQTIDYLLKRSNIPLPEYAPLKREHNSIEITHIEPLLATNAPLLIQYLQQRHINPDIASLYLKYAQIRFPYSLKNPTRIHHCLAWGNDSGGYEFRNSFLKVSNAPKNVTTLKDMDSPYVYLFEGWPDYLTYLTMLEEQKSDGTVMVLNSISFLNVMMPFFKDKRVLYWGQNDKAGDDALDRLKKEDIYCRDLRFTFKGHKDLNLYWVSENKKKGTLSELLKREK